MAVAMLSACSNGASSSGGASSDGPIIIGTSVSSTGKYASSGTNVANGYALAVEQINKNGGVLGRQLELKQDDDQSDAGTVGRLYTQFLTQDRADVLLSPYGSALAGPAAQLAERYTTPMAHSLTSSPAVFADTKYSVMAGVTPGSVVLAGVPQFAKVTGYTRVTLVNNDLDAYSEICDGAQQAVTAAGSTLVSRVTYAASTSDFSSVAQKVKANNPEVVISCSAIQDNIGITRSLDQQGFRPKILASATAEDPAFTNSLGSLANKAIGYSIWAPDLKVPGSDDFATAFQAKFGHPATEQSASAYATVQAVAAAITQAGSTDHEKLNDALRSGSYQTILGTYKVNDDGVQTGYKAVLNQYQNGTYALVYPESDASVPAEFPY
ncbi:amino acid ABC transporter substrate-binding protein [Rhodococcus sp. T7]|uniref:amino acid ABC transporter substrate-binding protein n=1 Tax=Rhodococcus sp. T7 TaxID=627444 RepID=UPI001359823E|nr:amino acid ABC transporter substrate-binding protein [Rhodococcus sp. T7]KAF0957814.1 hypothetical protein MLGJGCBP_09646 [Rhodococcus sp. T7]KAF0961533.1 hypothetical protein MLGJGCBP_05413 [Rhodococcus sp. T7]